MESLLRVLSLLFFSIVLFRADAIELQQNGERSPAASDRFVSFTAQQYLVPPDPRYSRDPRWPARLSLETVPPMSLNEIKDLVARTPWLNLVMCSGQPVSSAWLRRNGYPDYWTSGRFQTAYEHKLWTRRTVYPAQPEIAAEIDVQSPYRIVDAGVNRIIVYYYGVVASVFEIKQIGETGELILEKPLSNDVCPDGSFATPVLVPVEPDIS